MNKDDVKCFFIDAEPYRSILTLLSLGEQNAKSCGYLCSLLGMDDRVVRKHIENMRRNGVCILSSSRGFFLPANRQEVLRWKNHNLGVAGKYMSIVACADEYLKEC